MAIICYNGKFVTTAKSLETNVAVVTRADCNNKSYKYALDENPPSLLQEILW
jgi:hypothetical protein